MVTRVSCWLLTFLLFAPSHMSISFLVRRKAWQFIGFPSTPPGIFFCCNINFLKIPVLYYSFIEYLDLFDGHVQFNEQYHRIQMVCISAVEHKSPGRSILKAVVSLNERLHF